MLRKTLTTPTTKTTKTTKMKDRLECKFEWVSDINEYGIGYEGYIDDKMPFKGRGFFSYDNGDYLSYGEWTNGKFHNGVGKITIHDKKYLNKESLSYFIGGWKDGYMTGYNFIIEKSSNKINYGEILSINVTEIIDDNIVEYYNNVDIDGDSEICNKIYLETYKILSDSKFRAF